MNAEESKVRKKLGISKNQCMYKEYDQGDKEEAKN